MSDYMTENWQKNIYFYIMYYILQKPSNNEINEQIKHTAKNSITLEMKKVTNAFSFIFFFSSIFFLTYYWNPCNRFKQTFYIMTSEPTYLLGNYHLIILYGRFNFPFAIIFETIDPILTELKMYTFYIRVYNYV